MSSLQQLEQYQIEASIGSSRYARAFRAVDTVRKRTVTLQVLDPASFSDPGALRRFLQEAQSAADLVHPRLAWVWETGEADGTVYVAERHIPAPTLRQRLAESGPLSWEEASQAVEQLAQGLDFIHARNRVHAGVRPENIYLSPELGAVLGGFGIPPAPVHPQVENPEEARYIAPEVWMGEAPSPASDRYALACVLVEMLTGRPMFSGASGEAVCEQQISELNLPTNWPEDAPWQIEPVLERALAQQPEARYTSAADLAAAPARLAALPGDNEAERIRREELRRQRREAEEQARRQAEEAARLAALEQARREIGDQVRRETELTAVEPEEPVSATAAPLASGAVVATAIPAARRRSPAKPQSAGGGWRRRAWLGAAVALAALVWAWSNGWLPGAVVPIVPTTITPTTAITATQPRQPAAAATLRPSATNTPTITASPSATATRKPTATRTRTPTVTTTPTITETERPQPTPTSLRRERRDQNQDARG